jgi:hypothetical protein
MINPRLSTHKIGVIISFLSGLFRKIHAPADKPARLGHYMVDGENGKTTTMLLFNGGLVFLALTYSSYSSSTILISPAYSCRHEHKLQTR